MTEANNGNIFLKKSLQSRRKVNDCLWLFVISFERYSSDDKFLAFAVSLTVSRRIILVPDCCRALFEKLKKPFGSRD